METAAKSLHELAQLSHSLGQEALGREATVIRDALLNRFLALEKILKQAG